MARIIEYEETSTINPDDYLIIDGTTDGSRKIKPDKVGVSSEIIFSGKMNLLDSLSWTQGTISSTGTNANATNRIRIPNNVNDAPSINKYSHFNLNVSTGYKGVCRFYNSSKTFLSSTAYTESTKTIVIPENAFYVRFVLQKTDDSDITPSDGNNLEVNIFTDSQEKIDTVYSQIGSIVDQVKINLLWENGTISGTGKNQTSSSAMRTDKIIHIKRGSKIWKTSTDIAVTLVTYSHNDPNTMSGSQQILSLTDTNTYEFLNDVYCRFVMQNPNSHARSHSWASSIVKSELYDADFLNHEKGVDISVLGFPSYLGNGIVIRLPNGVWFGIDCYIAAAYNSVKAIYAGLGVSHFDYFMISHYHQDHVGNIVSLINDGYIDSDTIMILPPDLDTSYDTQIFTDWLNEDGPKAMYQTVRPTITTCGCTVIYPTEGQVISMAGVDFKFFNCDHSIYYPGGEYASTNYNDLSIGCYVTVGNYNFCDTADIGPVAQQKMVDLNGMTKANLYTATHHGWDNGNAQNYYGLIPAWINRLSPDVVISEDCSALDSRIMTKGAPMQSWCESTGVPNYRSRINGTMYITLNKYGWRFNGKYSRFIRNDKNWSYSDNSEHVED